MIQSIFKAFAFLFIIVNLCFACANGTSGEADIPPQMNAEIKIMDYPSTLRIDTIDDYHGTKVADPYRWLEDDRSEETEKWVKDQNLVTSSYIEQIPFRNAIEERMQKLWSYTRYSTPTKKGEFYYFFKNDGLQNQDILYRQKGTDGETELILDPNTLSADGTASLGSISFSENGNHLAYQVSEGGSDWHSIYVMNLENKSKLRDKVEWVKFSSISWYGDGFFYSRYPAPKGESKLTGENQNQMVYYHELKSSQAEDKPIYFDRSNPDRGFVTHITDDKSFLVLSAWESTSGQALFFKKLENDKDEFIPIIENFDHDYELIDNIGDKLLVLTNHEAPNKRIIAIDTKKFKSSNWKEIISETDEVLQTANIFGGKLVCTFIKNASSQIKIFDSEGEFLKEVKLPGLGTVQNIDGTKEDDQAFFSFTSFTRPTSIYVLDINSGEVSAYREPEISFDSEAYETKQVWFSSKDGTKVPMFITHKKGLKLDGQRPTLIYGYGGFDISILPSFNTTRLSLAPFMIENDGVFAVANIRGGGEFGKDWHQAGTKSNKQNVFNDFISASEYLIEKGYTSSEKLAAYGRSNGGLLVGACMTQRPDLYKVALPAVGVLDMLRYEKFTIGWAWASDYGSSSKPQDFKYLHAYSPLHNIEPADYPATLVTTADHDDRVVPAHSFKFISELQNQHKGQDPVMIRVATSAGHGAGKSTKEKIAEATDILSFMFYNFGEKPIVQIKN